MSRLSLAHPRNRLVELTLGLQTQRRLVRKGANSSPHPSRETQSSDESYTDHFEEDARGDDDDES